MRIKASKLLAAVLALCLTLGTAPAASAAALPQSAPGSQDITPYFLYIKGQDCILDISGRTAYINAWVSGQTSVATKCKVRAELQEKVGRLRLDHSWISGLTSRTAIGPRWTRRPA